MRLHKDEEKLIDKREIHCMNARKINKENLHDYTFVFLLVLNLVVTSLIIILDSFVI